MAAIVFYRLSDNPNQCLVCTSTVKHFADLFIAAMKAAGILLLPEQITACTGRRGLAELSFASPVVPNTPDDVYVINLPKPPPAASCSPSPSLTSSSPASLASASSSPSPVPSAFATSSRNLLPSFCTLAPSASPSPSPSPSAKRAVNGVLKQEQGTKEEEDINTTLDKKQKVLSQAESIEVKLVEGISTAIYNEARNDFSAYLAKYCEGTGQYANKQVQAILDAPLNAAQVDKIIAEEQDEKAVRKRLKTTLASLCRRVKFTATLAVSFGINTAANGGRHGLGLDINASLTFVAKKLDIQVPELRCFCTIDPRCAELFKTKNIDILRGFIPIMKQLRAPLAQPSLPFVKSEACAPPAPSSSQQGSATITSLPVPPTSTIGSVLEAAASVPAPQAIAPPFPQASLPELTIPVASAPTTAFTEAALSSTFDFNASDITLSAPETKVAPPTTGKGKWPLDAVSRVLLKGALTTKMAVVGDDPRAYLSGCKYGTKNHLDEGKFARFVDAIQSSKVIILAGASSELRFPHLKVRQWIWLHFAIAFRVCDLTMLQAMRRVEKAMVSFAILCCEAAFASDAVALIQVGVDLGQLHKFATQARSPPRAQVEVALETSATVVFRLCHHVFKDISAFSGSFDEIVTGAATSLGFPLEDAVPSAALFPVLLLTRLADGAAGGTNNSQLKAVARYVLAYAFGDLTDLNGATIEQSIGGAEGPFLRTAALPPAVDAVIRGYHPSAIVPVSKPTWFVPETDASINANGTKAKAKGSNRPCRVKKQKQ